MVGAMHDRLRHAAPAIGASPAPARLAPRPEATSVGQDASSPVAPTAAPAPRALAGGAAVGSARWQHHVLARAASTDDGAARTGVLLARYWQAAAWPVTR